MSRFPAVDPRQGATENRFGIVKYANATEAADANNDSTALSPKRLQNAPAATTSRSGVVELATDAETLALSATDKVVTPSNLAALNASETQEGIGEIATDAEAIAKTESGNKFLVPSNLAALGSSATFAGLIEIATDAEAQAKSDSGRAVVPANLAASGFVQWADVTITATEIKALATTAKELVAAPAAGSAHLFLGAVFKLNYGSEVFTEAGDNLGIKYTDASGVQVSDTIECTGFIDQSADTQTNAVPVKDAIVASASAEAQALVLDNLGNNFGGNASDDSTITCRVYYVTQAL